MAGLAGDTTVYPVRNSAADPFVGPLGEGAGKIDLPRALAALRDGVVVYSAASGSGQEAGTGPRDLQGSWQVGAIRAGVSRTQSFVAHAAPGVSTSVRFQYAAGHPSDGTSALPASWVKLPTGSTSIRSGRKTTVTFKVSVPSHGSGRACTPGRSWSAPRTARRCRSRSSPSVALHDPNDDARQPARPAGTDRLRRRTSTRSSTPCGRSSPGSGVTGAGSDWFVYPVELGSRLTEARFSVYDAAAGDETYDLYLYDADYDLLATLAPVRAPRA